jgi:hypothetical protein
MPSQTAPIKIYVGTQVEQRLAVKVLEHSIRQHTQHPIEVIPLFEAIRQAGITIPTPTNPALRPRTPFSFQRFAIPQLNNYKGRAIYLDSDMQVFQNIQTLWEWPFDGAEILSVFEPSDSGRRPQYSVMVLNCEVLDWDIVTLVQALEAGEWTYAQFLYDMAPARKIAQVLPTCWNDLERYVEGETALVHYTDMKIQPWLTLDNPLAKLWCRELIAAVKTGDVPVELIREDVEKEWVRPSLLFQIEHGIIDPQKLPQPVIQHDQRTFVPPHVRQRLKLKATSNPLTSVKGKIIKRLYILTKRLFNR